MPESMQLVKFAGAAGDLLLGWYHPARDPWGGLVLAHCFTCSKDLPLYRQLSRELSEAGLAVLRFDFTGIGQSAGDFARATLPGNVEDLRRAFAELGARVGELPLGLLGHSLGGVAVLLAAADLPRARALACIATPADPTDLGRLLGPEVVRAAQERGAAPARLGGRTVTISRALLDSLQHTGLPERVGALARPLLLLHGTDDEILPIAHSEALFAAADQPKGFEPLVGADHLLGEPRQASWASALLGLWFERHLAPHRTHRAGGEDR